ncbi:hypothetical protein JTE90_009884 [Oedothorax gibbosus]|uniref:Transmembrane protein n=1 Tax=Oedothorax gibbosus TaxID=931172 RepID=A0AAV6UUK3_9ARAC|nr:hypothetical protein JTE90_009884 [Oedothorax gibbosus]
MEEATEAIEIENHEMQSFAGVEPRFNLSFQHGHGSSFLSNISASSCVISYTRFAKTLVYVFLFVTCIPITVGGGFTIIFLTDENYHSGVIAFFTGCLSLGTASLFVLHLLKKLDKYHDHKTLEGLKVLGMIASIFFGILLGVYTILAFFYKQAFSLRGLNYFSSAVFSGVALATSIELFIVAQWYQDALQASAAMNTS